ncbi:TrmO family methyltransferase [Intrasporangium sp.]|uniref:TrmO family methyltransferase domain-containing protein n=1 Tax=Intrasporangium sp. TaxID=1925024 RepID=UPI0039779C1D
MTGTVLAPPDALHLSSRGGTSGSVPRATGCLVAFSHLEIVFVFDRVDPAKIRTDPRPARGNPQWPPVGVFAGHGPFRPNRLGVSRCRLLDVDGLDLRVADLDVLDGTPVLDIKPYMREFEPVGPVSQPAWSRRLMRGYHRAVQERISIAGRRGCGFVATRAGAQAASEARERAEARGGHRVGHPLRADRAAHPAARGWQARAR